MLLPKDFVSTMSDEEMDRIMDEADALDERGEKERTIEEMWIIKWKALSSRFLRPLLSMIVRVKSSVRLPRPL